MSSLIYIRDKVCKCNSGIYFNPFLHVFLFITLIFAIAFLFFPHTATVMAAPLYQQTVKVSAGWVDLWGIIALLAVVCHFIGMFVRGKVGLQFLRLSWYFGFYIWFWAIIVYLSGGFILQLLVTAVPNIFFWIWYAWQWRRRRDDKWTAFV